MTVKELKKGLESIDQNRRILNSRLADYVEESTGGKTLSEDVYDMFEDMSNEEVFDYLSKNRLFLEDFIV